MRHCLTILAVLFCSLAWCQNEEIDLEQFAERLFQVQDENISYEDIYESLLLYYTNKIDLNKAEPEELASLYLLTSAQLSNFFLHRDAFGDLLSIHELQAIPTFDVETIRQLKPFVTIRTTTDDQRPLLKRILDEPNNYFLLRYTSRIEQQKGYTEALPLDTTYVTNEEGTTTDTVTTAPNRYRGNRNKIYGRFRTSHRNDFSLGFTFEKDAGERFEFTDKQTGFDFYSYHLQLHHQLGFEKIVLGDFQLQAGQGIVFGAGFNAGKGAETVNTVKRNTLGLRPYTSVLEAGFFRGAGLSKTVAKNVDLTFFYSRLQQDANIQTDTTYSDFEEFINSIQQTGLHRTTSEVAAKDQLTEQSIGGMLVYRPLRTISAGVAALNSNYSLPIQRSPNNYNQYEFVGDHNYVTSVFANYLYQNFTLFGEVARSKSGGLGAVGGLVGSLSKTVDFAMALRNYDRNFHSFYGNAFSENSRNINEKGTYWGLSIKPNRRHTINAYYDRFKFPWLKYGTEAPSVGNEWLVRYTYAPARNVSLYAQVRQQTKQVSVANENLNQLQDQVKFNYLFNVDLKASNRLKLKTKVQSSHQTEGDDFSKGFVVLQDVNFSIWKLEFKTRIALFETDNFGNAQYVYENDVLFAFSIPAYNGSGTRNYVMLRYSPTRNVSLWARYARTTYPDATASTEQGSSLEASYGDTVSKVKLMLKLNF